MKEMTSTRSIRKLVVSTAAVCLMTLPVFASASILNSSIDQDTYNAAGLDSAAGQERLYKKLQNESRNVCGSSNIHAAGSVERAVDNEKCYRETLTVAVQRVGNEGLSDLHQN